MARDVVWELKRELHHLNCKIDRLKTFIDSKSELVTADHLKLMKKQWMHMSGYASYLEQRIEDLENK